jgi:peptidoglycan/xylan/chitin deacetylase (PgdA/CDA1 family)
MKHKILAASFPALIALNKTKSLFTRGKPQLRVLIYHGIAPDQDQCFQRQLEEISKRWQFVDAEAFSLMLSGEIPIERNSLLLTFDDGFISCRHVAETVLKRLDIKALFFIVSEFVSKTEDDWRTFVAQNINPHMQPQNVPGYCRNMSLEDLNYLLERGHTIGGHTATHVKLSQLSGRELEKEIIDSADNLERLLGIKVHHFAYTFGNLASFSPEALAIARRRFKYIYTGIRGNNSASTQPWGIFRDSIKPQDSNFLTGAFLEGGADMLYAKDRQIFSEWGSDDA